MTAAAETPVRESVASRLLPWLSLALLVWIVIGRSVAGDAYRIGPWIRYAVLWVSWRIRQELRRAR